MKKIFITILVLLSALSFAIVTDAASDEAKANYKMAKENANATYKAARAKCDVLSGNPKDVCVAEAKAEEKRSKADAQAQYENTPKAKMKARIAKAEADYSVAKEKCKAQTGNEKDVCIKEAKAVLTREKVDAKSHKEMEDIKSDARQEKQDAEYKVGIEKCDALAGPSKAACIAAVKQKYGK